MTRDVVLQIVQLPLRAGYRDQRGWGEVMFEQSCRRCDEVGRRGSSDLSGTFVRLDRTETSW